MDAQPPESSTIASRTVFLSVLLLGLGCAACARADESPRPAFSTPHAETLDVIYGKKFGMALTMDVFRPQANANGAGIVVMASGGWVSSSDILKLTVLFDEPLKRGYTVFSVYHGSQPKFTVPEVIADVRRAIRFIRFHAADYGIDPNRIGVTGGSAGGHLALILGTTGDDGNPKAADPIDRVSSRVQAVACLYPPTDLLNYGLEGKNAFTENLLVKQIRARPAVDVHVYSEATGLFERVDDPKKIEDVLREISPITHVTADDAPTLIVHGNADFLVPLQQSERIVPRFKAVGVPIELIVKQGAGHSFDDMESEYAKMLDWFDKYLKK